MKLLLNIVLQDKVTLQQARHEQHGSTIAHSLRFLKDLEVPNIRENRIKLNLENYYEAFQGQKRES